MTTPSCTLALDIGATKIAYALVPDDSPTEALSPGRLGTKDGKSPMEQIRLALSHGINAAKERGLNIARIGMGAPGVILGPEGIIVYNGETLTEWAGSDLRGLANKMLAVPFAAHNDVRVWAYGEHHLGAGKNLQGRVLYVSLGTGIGGAIVEDGRMMGGPTGSAGEFAEIVCADHAGRAVRCENVASGTGLTKYYNDAAVTQLDLPAIMERFHDGDGLAQQIINGNLRGFGQALGALVTVLDLSAVVIGGGVAGIGQPVTDPITQGIFETILTPNNGVQVLSTSLGAQAAVIAAAQYARDTAC
ncbi:ROK family transcriptional regulator [Corynebacterium suranareeae]|uniref:ROK family transcriptional regulator n=1 Tax=Corynebacterium suranareeae TaxID=2506452 RepID=A0A160PT78_9CORY|nr:ROK family protein [Corynebacterium suranareeae]BAU96994.1 ROK family transcriptional regulator [Corynebacterium suranareeae]